MRRVTLTSRWNSLWGRRRAVALRERLLESGGIDATLDALEAVLREMWRPPGLHPAVSFALAAFDRAPLTTSIAAVTDAIGLSAKCFIDRFKIEVGMTPKRYCRIRRFQRAVTWRTAAVTSTGRRWRSTAATSIRRTSFTTSGRLPASRQPRISQPGRRFRTTSNFYNPARPASETMALWLIQKTRIAP